MTTKAMVVDSDVICFESVEPDFGDSLHSHFPVWKGKHEHLFPPFTLFQVVNVKEGPFDYEGHGIVNQRLITVQATYSISKAKANTGKPGGGGGGSGDDSGIDSDSAVSKFEASASSSVLHFGSLSDAVSGMDGMVAIDYTGATSVDYGTGMGAG